MKKKLSVEQIVSVLKQAEVRVPVRELIRKLDVHFPSRISGFVNAFISAIQRASSPPTDESSSHLEIRTSPQIWERTNWIDGERLERDLAGCLSLYVL